MKGQLAQKKSSTAPGKGQPAPFFGKAAVQTKLTVNAPGDRYEQEADAIADKVMRMSSAPAVQRQVPSPDAEPIQRKCAHCEKEEKEKLRRKPIENSVSPEIVSSLQGSKGQGRPLPEPTCNWMERRFGSNFSSVNIHTGTKAVQLSRELNAQAFTHGRDIYFNQGKYAPDTDGGKRLLAHELTHVVQQNGGIHRSCSDGNCEDCADGWKTLRVTVFFRRRATHETMRILREKINEAKRILKECCINLYFDFNWRLLSGPDDFDPGRARPQGDVNGPWDYPNDAETLGEGNTFSGARGIPMLVVVNVPRTGGGVSVTTSYDSQYSANPYIVIPIEHGRTRSIAHELGHVAGILAHPATGVMSGDGTSVVNPAYCSSMRTLAT